MIMSEERNRYPEIRFANDFEISKNAPFTTVDDFVNTMGHLITLDMMVIRVTESLCPYCVDV